MDTRPTGPVIAAVFDNEEDATQALDALREAGVQPEQVSLLLSQEPEEGEAGRDPGAHIASAAASGATFGGVIGGLAGWLLGAGALVIPGIGPVLGAGVLGSLLAGAAIGAAAGGLLGGLVGLGIPEEDARTYAGHVRAGHVLLTVHAETMDRANALRDTLEEAGGYDVRVYEGVTDGETGAPRPAVPPPPIALPTEAAATPVDNTVTSVPPAAEPAAAPVVWSPEWAAGSNGAGPAERGPVGQGVPGVTAGNAAPVAGTGGDPSGRARELGTAAPPASTEPTPFRGASDAARTADPGALRDLASMGDRGFTEPEAPPADRGPQGTDTEFRSGGEAARGGSAP